MQRDNAAHRTVAPDAGNPDTPLNRLLRKHGAGPEAPASHPTSLRAAAAAAPATAPALQSVGEPAPAGISSVAATAPSAAQISPADLLVSKLLGRPIPGYAPAKRMSAPVSLPEDGKAIDVDYTPVEAPPRPPLEQGARAPLPAPETKPASTQPSIAPEDSGGEQRIAERAAPGKPVVQHPPASPPFPEASAARPLPTHRPETFVAASIQGTAQSATANGPTSTPPPAPRAQVAASAWTAAEPPVAEPPSPGPAPEALVAKPMMHSPAQDAFTGKPPPAPIFAPGPAAEVPAPRQGSALERSLGKMLPARDTAAEKAVGKMLALPRRTRDEREFLPAALEIVDTPPSPVGRAVGFTIIVVAIVAVAWSIIGKVDIVATASGRIVPAGKTKIVQPADTGIVTAIHVADGDQVKAGDVLIELNANQVSADRDRFVRDLLQANLNLSRLRGLAATLPGTPGEGKKPDLVDPPQDASPEDLALTLAAMRAQAANENAKLADLDQQIEAKRAEAAEAAAGAQKLQASLPMLVEQEQLLRAMRDQKIGSKLDWYQVNQRLIEQRHEIAVLSHRREAAEAAQRALREQRAAEATQYQMAVLSELDKMRAQASELNAELAKSQQRVSQNVLLAPIDGTVQQLAIHTIGGVVTPAESLLAIVPNDDSLVVEAAVQNRDVGFISAGQTVRVKVEAFNFTLYGLIEGKVLSVTRDAVQQPGEGQGGGKTQNNAAPGAAESQSGPVYMARIALEQDWMVTENGKVDLTPGMAVTAEIHTGQRRLISYLLSPLVRHVSESMRER